MVNSPVSIFQGLNKVNGSALSTAIKGSFSNSKSVSTTRLSICSGYQELAEALRISQSASVSLVGVAGGDESFEFFLNQKATTTSLHIIVLSTMVTDETKANSFESLIPPPTKDNVGDFVSTYGDCFVSAISRGALFAAVYSYYCQTSIEQKSIKASLSANGIIDGIIGSASISTSLQTFQKNANVEVKYDAIMIGTVNVAMPPQSQIADFALKFSALPKENLSPSVIGWETTGYESVNGYAGMFKVIRKNRLLLSGSAEDQLGSMIPMVQGLVNGIKEVQKIYASYGLEMDSSLDPALSQAKADLTTLKSLLDLYDDDPTQKINLPTSLNSLNKGVPSIKFQLDTDTCKVGVTNATASFDDAPAPGLLITKGMRLSAITISQDGFVFSIQATYIDKNGNSTLGAWCGEHRGYTQTFNIDGLIDKIQMTSRDLGKFSAVLLHCDSGNSPWPLPGALCNNWTSLSTPGFFPLAIWGNCWGDHIEGPLVRLGFKLAKLTGVAWSPLT